MKERQMRIRWAGAIVTPLVIAGCGTVVSVPITDESAGQPVTSTIDPEKQVKDFTPAEAVAWCTGYIDTMMEELGGTSSCNEPVKIEDGGFVSESCYSRLCDTGGSEPWLCVVVPTVDLCVQNLALNPCDATRSELDVCIASIRDADRCAADCGPFRSHPSCAETVVHKFDYFEKGGSRCRLAVE